MPDVQDFLGSLSDHKGADVIVELGIRADDLEGHDRPMAKLTARLGEWKMVDDDDRDGRAVAWVFVGDQDEGRNGFWVEADLVTEVSVGGRGGRVDYADGRYVTVVAR